MEVSCRELLAALPDDLTDVLRSARRGRLQLRVRIKDLERLSSEFSRAANRATVGLVVSALIVGTSLAMSVGGGPKLFDPPWTC